MWSALFKLALMGTDRKTPTAAQLPFPDHPDLHQVINQLDWATPEQALLQTAGAIALYQQAGQGPNPITPPPPPSAPDSRPLCSAQTSQHLRHALRHDPELCRDILRGIATASQQIPPELLPVLLDLGDRHDELQEAIHQSIGPRGRWLAAQNPAWHYAQWDWSQLVKNEERGTKNEETPQKTGCHAENSSLLTPHSSLFTTPFLDLWQTGTADQRLQLCQQWRQIAPDAARELIAVDWSAESGRMRSLLLTTLATGLSLADEAFLETALVDRNATVRTTAAHLLACLPDSAWCQQMTEWGRSLLTIQPKTHSTVQATVQADVEPKIHPNPDFLSIQITLPTLDDPTQPESFPSLLLGLSLGLSPTAGQDSGPSPLRQQQEALAQIIGCMPLNHWHQASPTDLIRAAANHPQGAIALGGWQLAALRQQNQAWADALLQQQLTVLHSDHPSPQTAEAMMSGLADLLLVLPLRRREALLTAYVPPSIHHQTSLLPTAPSLENGAADGAAIAQWLQLAIASCPRQWPGTPQTDGTGPVWGTWSQAFSDTVLAQLRRDLAHNPSVYLREMQTLARPIGLRLAPMAHSVQALSPLKEHPVPGSPYQQRQWLQTVDIMHDLVNRRLAIWQELAGGQDSPSHPISLP